MKAEALIGTKLGSCTLQKIIGQGGMGAVFLAQQSRPRRQVAVKVLLPATVLTSQQRAAFLERFRRETDAAASLEHPNILPVHEYDERDGLAYLVVPYVSGGTLRDALEREGPLALSKAANYLEQMAAALDFAHERGVIHRDIKPANILMTPEERLLLTDFGLVKIITGGQTPQTRLTGAGAPVGTPDYMAPEQVIGEVVDGRSDLYSLGVILYQMVTGTTPFQGETPMQIAAKQMQSPPPSPRLLRPDLPLTTEQVMLQALAKRPADRYASCKDFAEAFRASLNAGTQLGDVQDVPRSTGLLSRTGLFPTVGTGRIPAAGNKSVSGALPSTTGAQSVIVPPKLGALGKPTAALPAFTGAQPAMKSAELGQVGKLTRTLPAFTGAQPAMTPPAVPQISPMQNTTGSLVMPKQEAANIGNAANTVKLTGPVKVVQVPVAGQPGKYVTGLLPVIPETQPSTKEFEQADAAKDVKGGPKKFWLTMILSMLVVLVILSTGASYWYLHVHSSQGTQHLSPSGTSQAGQPNLHATATARAQATADANLILKDSLKTNIHNFPVSKNEFFKDGAYHIVNTEGSAVAVVLPEMPFSIPNAYTLTMWEVKGDDTSNNNSFGLIVRFNQQKNQAGKVVTTFYSFEVLNTQGGEYRFYKYDDSQPSSDKYWNQLWSQPFGSEFHQGQGPKNVNTIRIYQNGSSFSFTVNGKFIGTTHDSAFKSGTVGMLVNLKGTEVAFTNMVITHK